MKTVIAAIVIHTAALFSLHAFATGLATCDVPEAEWQPQEKLEAMLQERGWQVRRIKVDGGCYEAYALDENGDRVEAYFNPKTFELIPTEESDRR